MSGEHDHQGGDGRDRSGGRTSGDRTGGDGATPSPRRIRLLGALALTMLASCLLTLAPLPLSLVAGATSLATLVLLVPVVIGMVRDGRRGAALGLGVIGTLATGMILLSTLTSALFYGPMHELQECRATAITVQAEAACTEQVQGSVVTWMEGLLGG
ncbi:hypothetical protein ACXET9_13390 [Brachybacterium sp. DNPG3]